MFKDLKLFGIVDWSDKKSYGLKGLINISTKIYFINIFYYFLSKIIINCFSFIRLCHTVTTERCHNSVPTKATGKWTRHFGQWPSVYHPRKLCRSHTRGKSTTQSYNRAKFRISTPPPSSIYLSPKKKKKMHFKIIVTTKFSSTPFWLI